MSRVTSRAVSCCALTIALTGCLSRFPAPSPAVTAEPIFDPTKFFDGQTAGHGTLKIRIGADRALRVQSVGTTEANGDFRLDQTITFADSVVETRTWRLHRVDAQHYSATLSDASGPVMAESNGNRFHLRYRIRRGVQMEQWLYLRHDGRAVENLAQITVFGVPWARISETILRSDTSR